MKFCRRNHLKPPGQKRCLVCERIYKRNGRETGGADELTPDWYDWVAVERAVHGRPIGRELTKIERTEYLRRTEDKETG